MTEPELVLQLMMERGVIIGEALLLVIMLEKEVLLSCEIVESS